jgi:hypothetical protein
MARKPVAVDKRLWFLIISLGALAPLRFIWRYDPRTLPMLRDSPQIVVPGPELKAVLYITTHFSEVHVRYFHCCWPILVNKSPLMQNLHIIVAATNATPVPQKELDYLEKELFVRNPSYQFLTPSTNPNHTASHLAHCEPFRVAPRMNPNKKESVSYKQCLANYGVWFGWSTVTNFDWMIRLNPDVLVRHSAWFLDAMRNTSLDALLIDCGEGTRQIHTDFWAIRPSAIVTAGHNKTPFENMSKVRNRLNHERTAFHQFQPIMVAKRHAWVPGVEPSHGTCRVRGSRAPVLHNHDSCLVGEGICHGLEGWDVSK